MKRRFLVVFGACCIAAIAIAGWVGARGTDAGAAPIRLAVLPFEAGQSDNVALARGLSLEFAERISYAPGLVVRPPALANRQSALDLELLDADLILDAEVHEADDEIRVHVWLHSGAAGYNSDVSVAVPAGDVVDLPQLLAREVVAALGLELAAARAELMARSTAGHVEAFRDYLIILGTTGGRGAPDPVAGLADVIERDPAFAPAYAALADQHLRRGRAHRELRTAEYDRAEQALRAALDLDPELPSALAAMATLMARTARQAEATALARRAIEVHPYRPELYSRLGYVLRYAGLVDESVAAYRRGLELDGRPAALVSGEGQIAKGLVYLGDYYGALALQEGLHDHLARIGRTADEKMLFYEGVMQYYAGSTERALQLFDAAWDLDPTSLWSAFGRAYGYGIAGDTTRLVALARELETRDVADGERHYRLVHFHALAGRHEDAARRLRVALDGGFVNYAYMSTDPLTAAVRDTPAFAAALSDAKARYEAFPRPGR